jgi:L-2-hydroxycarboxylate dehydrogenase (NAD+)
MADREAKTLTENVEFIEYMVKRYWLAAGASEAHADAMAYVIGFAHRQGKLNQGLGVFEAPILTLMTGNLDIEAEPEILNEGPAWAVVDGHRSSGQYTLVKMANIAIEKARETGVAYVMGANHNDCGSYAAYTWLAYQQNMAALASNNSPPLAAPFGGMENKLAVPPWDGIIPSGEEEPIWMSTKLAEFYDADVATAYLQGRKMKGKWLIDPETGELTDDPRPYFVQIEGMGRVSDYTAAGQIAHPRTYTQNLFMEGLTSIINPIGRITPHVPRIAEFAQKADYPSVGGSFFMAFDPSVFGPIDNVKAKADDFASIIKNTKPRPGKSVRMPGAKGYKTLMSGNTEVLVLENHWAPFWEKAESNYGLTEEQLRTDFATENA